MHSIGKNHLFEILKMVPSDHVIPVLEKGLEIEKLELTANPQDERRAERVRYSSAVLAFLYSRKLGL